MFIRNIVERVSDKPYGVHVTDLSRREPAVATEGTSLPSRGRAGWKTTVCPLLVILPLMSSKYALGKTYQKAFDLQLSRTSRTMD